MFLTRRKWGFYITLLDRRQFKVKLLRFKKRGALSMQRHSQRAELWLFLSGYGKMLDRNYYAGDYYFIACGEWHKYIAGIKTWILEIQYGKLCSEKDIERKDENI